MWLQDLGNPGKYRWLARIGEGALALSLILTAAPEVHAEEAVGDCALIMDPNNAPSTDPRIHHLVIDGVKVNVLVPPGYYRDRRRYPVLYLFHGAFGDHDSWSTQTDLLTFTSSLRKSKQALVVMPDGGHLPAGRDWVDGTRHQESFVINTLVPYIDSHYRTYADRSHRAAAGFSAGGMNALLFTARHPDMFAAVGSFSGFVHPYTPSGIAFVMMFADLDNQLCGAGIDPLGIWGDPEAHPMGWVGHDPVHLARGLASAAVYLASGNGVPCTDDPLPSQDSIFAESVVYDMNLQLDQALTSAGIRHVTEFDSCGAHQFSNASSHLRRFWRHMLAAFGKHPPREFDYRTPDSEASVFDWTFVADASRAPEFLDVSDVSRHGLSMTGSGITSITTPRLFRSREWVSIDGTGFADQVLRADREGRIQFSVNLGHPHPFEGYTPEWNAAAAAENYFVTRHITFSRTSNHDECR